MLKNILHETNNRSVYELVYACVCVCLLQGRIKASAGPGAVQNAAPYRPIIS